jgi:hypothetical protein
MADTCAVKAVQDARPVRRVAPGVPDYMNFEMDFDFNGSGPGLIHVLKSSH